MIPLTVENIEAVLRPVFPSITVTLTEEEASPVYVLGYTGASIRQVEMQVTRHSILDSRVETVTGWQAFVFVSIPATRDSPANGDEAELTPAFESLAMAITTAAGALVMAAIGDAFADIPENYYDADLPF